jgi:hypothetical protein
MALKRALIVDDEGWSSGATPVADNGRRAGDGR